ncbi:FAD-binding oxidoreductase [Actibacterium sp. XHP0104]|uniref:FAD-binding oxidoreductase n=1 Tax=Actibacterium sp. XHP0104 TaxID=2984335 RepID=UPI0021E790C6|nr:FAD-binding oxidoreductase [Actibacterium sp. XHP0104]MCV2880537.1 FAD-binding oxidoreductase [Actibacterium sp. XHP0104]
MPLNAADDAFAARLRAALPDVIRPLTPAYLQEPRGRFAGQGGVLVAPRSTQEVAQVVRLCAEAGVGVVPYGGGTGLVGGQVMPDGPAPVIVSLERMRAVRAVHPTENVIVAEAGVILADLQAAAFDADRLFPLSLASEGSARVGGVLATNAGGVNVLRYGNARDLCLGIEAVLPDGSVLNTLGRLRKDNTGYDLRNLLIGSEGSLGIITAAALKLYPRPAVEGAALFVTRDPQAAVDLLAMAGRRLGGVISAFELISGVSLQFLAETMPDIRQPFAKMPDWMVLIDLGMGAGADAQVALEGLFAEAVQAGLTDDGVIAQSGQQRAEFWALREHIPLANRAIGAIGSHDVSVPISLIPEFITRGGTALAALGDMRVNCFGHLGDGNLHYNVFPARGKTRDDYDAQRSAIKTCVHDLVHQMGGSVSAEHGVGRLKVDDLERYGDPAKLAAMRAIKAALDPRGIMNPGVILRAG